MTDTEDRMFVSGHYKVTSHWYKVILVEGVKGTAKGTVIGDFPVSINYGVFGESDPVVGEKTGEVMNNIEFSVTNQGHTMKEVGVITEDKKMIVTKSLMGVHEYHWITDEEAAELLEDGDPIEAPPAPYKLQPDNQGRLVWLTGPPGLGKSTTAQLLARHHGHVYYEADCFNSLKNPYIPIDVEDPTMAQNSQRTLKGEGLQERKDAIGKMMKGFQDVMKGEEDDDFYKDYYSLMCQDIQREKERLGGDWAVAQCILRRSMRDFIRSKLGPELVIILLEMDLDHMKERLSKRHEDQLPLEWMETVYKICEPAEDDEENVLTLKISPDMSREDVVKMVLDRLQ